jgi:carboxypeptidase Q
MTANIRRTLLLLVLPICTLLAAAAPALAQGNEAVIDRIIKEGKNNSNVWLYLEFISKEIGPRLTGSTRLERANNWTRDMFESFGCENAHLFQWGEIPVRFDRGPSFCRMIKPIERDLEFTARAWSAGTDGTVTGKVVKQPANMKELEAMKDELKGTWVLSKPIARGGRRGVVGDNPGGAGTQPATQPAREGATDAPPPPADAQGGGAPPPPADAQGAGAQPPAGERRGNRERGAGRFGPGQNEELINAMYEAGIAGRLVASNTDLVVTGGERGWREMKFDDLPTQVSISISRKDYDMLNSRLADGETVEIEANLDHRFSTGPDGESIPLYNTVAEIPGTEFPEQVVIVSAHLDSWDGPGSQGAQDNGTGSAVTLEAARILKAAGVKPRRTIRFCLWTGEEQGLLGSREYVNSLSDEEKANISAVLVDDGGTNYQGGLVCIAEMEEMLKTATEPVTKAFPDMPVDIIVRERMPRGGGSDHASFNREGIPGFFWEEDGLGGREGKNYTFVHHTQHDTTRYAVHEYLIQSATCSAITAYNLAMADDMLPRPPAPPATQPETPPETPGDFTPTPGPLTGTWVADVERNGNVTEAAFTFTLEHATDGRLRGFMFSRYGEGRIRRAEFNSDTGELTFRFNTDMGSTTNYKATVKGEEMTGTLGSEDAGFSMEFTARKTSSEIQQPVAEEQGQAGQRRDGSN